jgi:hypothetical protein
MEIFTGNDILQACRLLFRPDFEFTMDYIKSLNINSLKSAYRNKIFDSHPDRAKLLGLDAVELCEIFKIIDEAYKKLSAYIIEYEEKNEKIRRKEFIIKTRQDDSRIIIKKYPDHELLFGQFLFYSGHISLNMLLDAIHWQRLQRPSFGEIALKMNFLHTEDIGKILRNKSNRERFGECAVRFGIINSFQFRSILEKQQKSHLQIGQYFIRKRILSPDNINASYKLQHEHNCRVKKIKSGLFN